jgi:hypothetical protein
MGEKRQRPPGGGISAAPIRLAKPQPQSLRRSSLLARVTLLLSRHGRTSDRLTAHAIGSCLPARPDAEGRDTVEERLRQTCRARCCSLVRLNFQPLLRSEHRSMAMR